MPKRSTPVEEQTASAPEAESAAQTVAMVTEAEESHLVVEDADSWFIYHRGAHAASMNTNFPVYDGWIEVRDGCARIPKDRPDWAQRLLRFENFAWCHGPEEAPESFLRAIGA